MLSTLPTLLSLIALPLPFTLATTNPSNSTTNATITPPSQYYLKTRVIGDGNPDKNDLYLSAYHTGAGENDVVLQPFSTNASTAAFLNGTYQQFDIDQPGFPWGLVMDDTEISYAEWKFVYIEPGYGAQGFAFNASGLQWVGGEDGDGFAGWLACDWWHGLPQLFWKYYFYEFPLPSSCAQVELVPVAV